MLASSAEALFWSLSQDQEQKARIKSTRVFQDEELLFTQKLQKDNDPDVDLFSTSVKPTVRNP